MNELADSLKKKKVSLQFDFKSKQMMLIHSN